MNLGDHEQARFEFLTAIELKDDNPLPAVNLVTLSLVEDNWQQAADLVTRLGSSRSSSPRPRRGPSS